MPTPEPLDDVAFLARSPHRVQVLESLVVGPMTRPDLHEETGISQPTLGRILGPFEDRNWVEKRGREYALTAWGELLAADLGALLGTVETIRHLGDVAEVLPTSEMDFDVRRLGDASITTPESGDMLRYVQLAEKVLGEATHVRIAATTIWPPSLEEQHDRVTNAAADDDLLIESVLTAEALAQAFADQRLVDMIRDLLASGRAPVYRYEGTFSMTIANADGTAILVPGDEQGLPRALVQTEDDVVRAWVDDQFDAYRDAATALTVDDLPT